MSGKIGDNLFRASGVIAEASADFDDDQLQSNIAMLGFKAAVNGSLVRYNLVNQTIDEYFDTSGVDASASVNDNRVASGSNYYYTGGTSPTVTGPDSTTTDGSDTIYWITSTGATSFDNDTTQDYEMLVIAGGGSAGRGYGGAGGGAGGLLHNVGGTKIELVGGTTYTCTVGAGGAAITSGTTNGIAGSDTTITGSGLTTITATGGGGGQIDGAPGPGQAGGSGGGGDLASGYGGIASQGDSGGLTGYGNNGGRASKSNNTDSGGGGGGANGAGGYPQTNSGIVYTGQEVTQPNAGDGGIGLQVDIDGNNYYWAVGGGSSAAASIGVGGYGGTGGGGGGGNSNGHIPGIGGGTALNSGGTGTSPGCVGGAGGANTGSGGGGTSHAAGTAGAGGSGVIALRAPTSVSGGDMTLQSTDVTATAQPDYGELVTLMEDGEGTATLNTDIKGYISRDSGTTFTQGTLANEGSWGTNKKILAFHDLDISGQPAGTSMCYKITTHNQSAGSKETNIWATSIGWR